METQGIDWGRVLSSACIGGGIAAVLAVLFMTEVKHRGFVLVLGGVLIALGVVLRTT